MDNELEEKIIESRFMDWDTSMAILETMDEVRSQVGLAYPFEK